MTLATPFLAGMLPANLAVIFLIGCAHENTNDYRRADYSSHKPLKSHHSGANELADRTVPIFYFFDPAIWQANSIAVIMLEGFATSFPTKS